MKKLFVLFLMIVSPASFAAGGYASFGEAVVQTTYRVVGEVDGIELKRKDAANNMKYFLVENTTEKYACVTLAFPKEIKHFYYNKKSPRKSTKRLTMRPGGRYVIGYSVVDNPRTPKLRIVRCK